MKKLSIIIFLIALVGLFSCKKDETKATISANPVPPVLKLTVDSMTLKKAYADTLITFQWTAASFGINVVTTYTVQVDKKGSNFKNALAVGSVSSALSLTVLTSDLNNKLLGFEFNPDLDPSAPLSLEFRVQASYNTTSTPAISPTVSKVVTPYYVKIVYPFLFVPGNYNSWNAGDSLTVIYSARSDNNYDGYIFLDASAPQYKYSLDPKWVTNWGDNGGTGTLVPGGSNIAPTTGPGYYHLTANINTLTHTFLLTTWSLFGTSTGSTDVAMAYDSVARTWSVTSNLTAGLVYFRANNSNTLAYSDPNGTGGLSLGTDGITVTDAGNYTVTLNFTGAIFRYNLKKN
jgi:hypothetical protein